MFDLRIDLAEGEDPPTEVNCPVCGCQVALRGSWLADSDGHGSRGDYAAAKFYLSRAEEEVFAFRTALHERDPDAVSAVYTKLLESHK